MRKRRYGDDEEFDFWKSNTDLMTGLVIVLLAVVMLLSLYVLQIPEYSEIDPELGDSYNIANQIDTPMPTTLHGSTIEGAGDGGGGSDADTQDGGDDGGSDGGDDGGDDDGGGGGGDAREERTTRPEPTTSPSPMPSMFPGIGGDGWHKAAVLVNVVDGETGRAIREPGITFELYEEQAGQKGVLRYLYNYYPVKCEYREYATTEEGIFYLPEKIEEGRYYFHQISEVNGYDSAESVAFEIDETYDWPEPFVVSVSIFPSKNVIRMRVLDADTNEPVTSGTFRVTALENIYTKDQSLRFAAGQEADVIALDANGAGISQELYLGEYAVTQDEIPPYYAHIDDELTVTVGGRQGGALPELRLMCQRTQIRLRVTDTFTGEALPGAAFTLSCDHYPELTQTGETDRNGQLRFTDLEKNRAYKLTQTGTVQGYHYTPETYTFIVNAQGRIEGEAVAEAEIENFVPRLAVTVRDKVFGHAIAGESLALYDANDTLIRRWASTGGNEVFEDLPQGAYYVLVDDDASRPYQCVFDGGAAMQTVTIALLTPRSILILAGGAAAILSAGGVALVIRGRIKRKRRGA